MEDYSKYDIEEGFVLKQGKALEFLKWTVEQEFEQSIQTGALGIDSESAGAFIEDVIAMAQTIVDNDWEWVKFSECAPSASGIMIKQMVEKE